MPNFDPISPQQMDTDVFGDEINPGKKKNELNPDDFIKLFLTQLKHQNPMQPTDSNTMLQQMSNIGQINASKDMQKTMAKLAKHVDATLANSQVLGATQLIGKKVEIPWKQAHMVVTGEGDAKKGELKGSALLMSSASDVNISISKNGKVVKTIPLGPCASAKGGLMDFTWDGKGEDGKVMDDGFYDISASAVIDGKSVPLNTAGAFEVKSVATNPENGKVIINVDGLGGKYLTDIIKIMS